MEDPNVEDTYKTLSKVSSGLFKDRSSKFHYFAFPVKTEEEIKNHLADLRKTYYDARHHCFAWVLGINGDSYRANDDGEPNHSAGDPILGQIRSNQLTNILIVVVRYFGGTKLGMSGLINAYKTAAAMAIEENEIIEEQVKSQLKISFSYPAMNEVMKLVKNQELNIIDQQMSLDCQMTLEMRQGLFEFVLNALQEIESLQILEVEE
ncbi:MAG: IMPACT family protein [Bacteroidota bacterium]